MSERRDIKVELLTKEFCSGPITAEPKHGDDLIVELIAWLQEHLSQVPEKFRDAAFIEIDTVSGYEGSCSIELILYYNRPETDDELNARRAGEEARRQAQEYRDRVLYEELAKKFGKSP